MSNINNANIFDLPTSSGFSNKITSLLESSDWGRFTELFSQGLDPSILNENQVSLFEIMMAKQTYDTFSSWSINPRVPQLPSKLLMSMLANLPRGEMPGIGASTAIVLCAYYGQIDWMKNLLVKGFEPESENSSALHAFLDGRFRRATAKHLNDNNSAREAINSLLSFGASSKSLRVVNISPLMDETAFMTPAAFAVWANDIPSLEALPVNSESIQGVMSAIDAVKRTGIPDAVPTLIRKGVITIKEINDMIDDGVGKNIISSAIAELKSELAITSVGFSIIRNCRLDLWQDYINLKVSPLIPFNNTTVAHMASIDDRFLLPLLDKFPNILDSEVKNSTGLTVKEYRSSLGLPSPARKTAEIIKLFGK